MRVLVLPALLLLVACGGESPDRAQPGVANTGSLTGRVEEAAPSREATSAPPVADPAWLGKWTGPEGLFVTIAEGEAPGIYEMVIKGDLDSRGDPVTGRLEDGAIRFVRAGKQETLRRGSGDETGLKWLAGKRDCLIVRAGEGFCRN